MALKRVLYFIVILSPLIILYGGPKSENIALDASATFLTELEDSLKYYESHKDEITSSFIEANKDKLWHDTTCTGIPKSRNDISNRALELSLYYAGFPKEIFGKIDYRIPPDMWKLSPGESIRHLKRAKVRDAKKAILFAKISEAIAEFDMKAVSRALIESYEFEGIGCPQSVDVIYKSEKSLAQAIEKRARMYEKANEKFKKDASEKALKCLKELKESLDADKEIQISEIYNPKKAYQWRPYRIYVNYHGLYGFKKDLEKVRRVILACNKDIWLNFYTGFLAPQDTELAKYILKIQNTEESLKHLQKIKEESGN